MSNPHRLHVKIGPHEFEAEGSEEAIRAQFEQFLDAIAAAPPDVEPPKHREDAGGGKTNGNGNGTGNGGREPLSIDPATKDRAFIERDGIVSLRVLPQTQTRDADALLLLLYGFRLLQGKHDVPVIQLMQGAKQSGLKVDRADRPLAVHERLVTKGGFKRGSRYGLNNQGVNHAETILKEMFS